MTNYALSYPAVNGDTVTQGHADYCATHGHGTYTVDGVVAAFCPRCGEATSHRFLNTVEAMDYTLDEIDDLTDRKVEAIEVDGDALARMIRTRRGTARFTEQEDPYANVTDNVDFDLWNGSQRVLGVDGNPRMVAVGFTDGVGNTEVWHAPLGRITAFHL